MPAANQTHEIPALSLNSFADIFALHKNSSWKAVYEINVYPNVANSTSMTVYQMGKNTRTDTAINGINASSYILSGKFYDCVYVRNYWTCVNIPTNSRAVSDASSLVESDPFKYDFTSDGSMQVAGVSAKCFRSENVSNADVRYCFSKEGVILYQRAGMPNMPGNVTFGVEMKASSYAANVDASVFKLPAIAKNMSD